MSPLRFVEIQMMLIIISSYHRLCIVPKIASWVNTFLKCLKCYFCKKLCKNTYFIDLLIPLIWG